MLGPIFDREWLILPRRPRHYLMRSVYLGALWVLVLTVWQTAIGWEQPATLGDQARFGLLAFQVLAFVQMSLLLFFAALTAASTIAQEKDRRTFVLLLLTDLRNYEIVLGKLVGSLLPIGIFLAGMVPILALLLLLGGVAPFQVVEAAVVLVMTALAAGSLGGLIALWREKTFQSLALTFLLLILYLALVQALSILPLIWGRFAEVPDWLVPDSIARLQTWLQPFLALHKIIDPLDHADAVSPALGFTIAMALWTLLINGLAILKLRAWNPSGEPVMQREHEVKQQEDLDRARAHAAPGAARPVWANPILWREIATRAYGRRTLLVKAAYFLLLGLVCYYALGPQSQGDWAAARGLVPVGILSLLLVSAQAVTSITSERDLGALDLLFVTDLTPREFIFGKIFGILYNAKEYLLPTVILAGVYAWRGQLASAPQGFPELAFGKNLEAFICIVIGSIILMAFTILLGMHVALRNENSRLAITSTLGTIFFLSIGTLVCIYLILINGTFEAQWFSFLAFICSGVFGLMWVLCGASPTPALVMASWACPFAVFYSVTNVLIGRPGVRESTDPFMPLLVTGGAFGFTIAAMLVPLLAEFDVAVGRTSAQGE